MYAAVCAAPEIRKRIMAVYNNDGPGFLEAFTQTEAYREMLPRMICTVPEDSVIGTLLTSEAYQHIVKSNAFSIVQHDGFSWQVLGTHFVEVGKRSEGSLFLENTVRQWLGEQTEENRRTFVSTLFGMLEATGHETLSGIKSDLPAALANMKKMLDSIPKEQRETSWNMLVQFFTLGGGNVIQETKKSIKAILDSLTAAKPENRKTPEPDA